MDGPLSSPLTPLSCFCDSWQQSLFSPLSPFADDHICRPIEVGRGLSYMMSENLGFLTPVKPHSERFCDVALTVKFYCDCDVTKSLRMGPRA